MNDRGNIVIYQTKDGKTSIDVKLEDETVWLTGSNGRIVSEGSYCYRQAY